MSPPLTSLSAGSIDSMVPAALALMSLGAGVSIVLVDASSTGAAGGGGGVGCVLDPVSSGLSVTNFPKVYAPAPTIARIRMITSAGLGPAAVGSFFSLIGSGSGFALVGGRFSIAGSACLAGAAFSGRFSTAGAGLAGAGVLAIAGSGCFAG